MHATALPPSSTGPSYPRWSETLRDHSYVRIRPVDPREDPGEREFLERTPPPDARRFRLLGLADYAGHLIDQATGVVYTHEVEFVAVTPEDSLERIVGASRYRTDREGLHCECAVTINGQWEHAGLAALLMKHLIEVARAQGIRRMTCVDPMLDVLLEGLTMQLGFHSRMDPENARRIVHELDL